MKGKRKNKKNGFKPGHTFFPGKAQTTQNAEASPWQPRLSAEMYDLVVRKNPDGTLSIPDADGREGPARLLHPKPRKPSLCDQYLQREEPTGANTDDMRLVHAHMMLDMYNTVMSDHREEKCTVYPTGDRCAQGDPETAARDYHDEAEC